MREAGGEGERGLRWIDGCTHRPRAHVEHRFRGQGRPSHSGRPRARAMGPKPQGRAAQQDCAARPKAPGGRVVSGGAE
ncbi:hypothetical protein [Streptomyces chiangmaiensis]|uniref:Uncharacterized protein n=1 Tax=Streptomyces chiangmaiensis TaxID=766497 RepID=A0ABU7FCV8_9ACTN|nr:hypothetical protein [Streptomyces chiangmaiensis]MED7821734.1 hypothetical protein [Streptomyces chiangmaiensis]